MGEEVVELGAVEDLEPGATSERAERCEMIDEIDLLALELDKREWSWTVTLVPHSHTPKSFSAPLRSVNVKDPRYNERHARQNVFPQQSVATGSSSRCPLTEVKRRCFLSVWDE